jgi:hypothetical protein
MPLTPLSPSVINSKPSPIFSPHSLDLGDSIMSSPSKPVFVLKNDDHLADEINWEDGPSSPFVTELPPSNPASRKSSSKADLDTVTLRLTPSQQLHLEAAPFEICEDETSMPKSPEKERIASPNKHSASTATLPADDIDSIDTAGLNGDDTIDDTCFSAFSEIPNMEMTRFARMGSQSPSKRSVVADQVCFPDLR